jgi:ribosomal protein S27AE
LFEKSGALEKGRDSSARKMPVPIYSDKLDDVVAAVSICPDCGMLAFAYRSSDAKRNDSDRWDFMCARCGTEFVMPEGELVFQPFPKEWLLSRVYTA